MPNLDRRIVVLLETVGSFVAGEYVPGNITRIPMWAEYLDAGTTDEIAADGVRTTRLASFRIRYREDVRNQLLSLLRLEFAGNVWNAETIAESSERRRFITITAVLSGPIP